MLPHLTISDTLILMLYLGAALAVVSYALMRRKFTTDVYFFSGRRSGWIKLGASLFTSQFLLAVFFPLTGSFLAVALAVMACSALMLAGLAAVRLLAAREGDEETRRSRSNASGGLWEGMSPYGASAVPVAILGFVRLAAALLFCSYALEFFTGWNPGSYTIVIILVVGLFTIIGGYQAVSATQAFFMTGAFASVLMLAMTGSGIGFAPEPWPMASLGGLIVLAAWSWSGDLYFVQPMSSARSSADAAKALVFTVALNGLCWAALLFTRADAVPPPDAEFQAGTQGVIIAGILSLTMSSLGGIFSSSAAFFTLNVFQPRLSNPSERKLVLVGRLVTTAIVIAAIVAVMAVRALGTEGSGMLQTACAAAAAPLAALYWCNLFNRSRGWSEARWPAAPALAAGVLRLSIDAAASQGAAIEGWAAALMSIHYLSLSFYLFAATVLVFAARSLPALVVRYRTGNE